MGSILLRGSTLDTTPPITYIFVWSGNINNVERTRFGRTKVHFYNLFARLNLVLCFPQREPFLNNLIIPL